MRARAVVVPALARDPPLPARLPPPGDARPPASPCVSLRPLVRQDLIVVTGMPKCLPAAFAPRPVSRIHARTSSGLALDSATWPPCPAHLRCRQNDEAPSPARGFTDTSPH